jgi:hypothetical protein
MWMTGLLFNTVAGVYTLFQLKQRSQSIDKKEGEGAVEGKKLNAYVSPFTFISCSSSMTYDHGAEDGKTMNFY